MARVASNILADAERLTAPYDNATPALVDMGDRAAVEKLVEAADVVIRYLPFTRCLKWSANDERGPAFYRYHSTRP